jgi:hypothetical protein
MLWWCSGDAKEKEGEEGGVVGRDVKEGAGSAVGQAARGFESD